MSLVGIIGKGFGPTTVNDPPVAPIISVVDNKDGTGGIVSIVGSSLESTNNIYYFQHGNPTWILIGSRLEDGDVVVAPGNGSYWWKVESITVGGLATSNLVYQSLTDSTIGNPFVKVFNALWDLLESDPEFTSRIPIGNRVKYNLVDNRDPLKQQITTADMPEFAIWFTGAFPRLINTSSSSMFIARYRFIVNTGDYRINEITNLLNWVVAINLVRWQTILSALTWKNQTFVKRVDATDLQIGESDPLRNRGINGWVSLWEIEVEMHLQTTNLVFSE